MTGTFHERLAAYLSQYMSANGEDIPPKPAIITAAISKMIEFNYTTPDRMRREALEQFDVIIPDDYFTKEAGP